MWPRRRLWCAVLSAQRCSALAGKGWQGSTLTYVPVQMTKLKAEIEEHSTQLRQLKQQRDQASDERKCGRSVLGGAELTR